MIMQAPPRRIFPSTKTIWILLFTSLSALFGLFSRSCRSGGWITLTRLALPMCKMTYYTSASFLNLFHRPHLGQGRHVCEGQRIHGSLIPQAWTKYKSQARHWQQAELRREAHHSSPTQTPSQPTIPASSSTPQVVFTTLIQTQATRYLAGDPGHFWEIDDYERARIFLWAIGLSGPPERSPDETKPSLEPQSSQSELSFFNVPVLTTGDR
jgi:hypothetical protein